MRAKTNWRSAAHKFRVGDPVWLLRPRPMGTHRTKTWFAELVRTPTACSWETCDPGLYRP